MFLVVSIICSLDVLPQEVYLLQTRQQKMPYKYIAAHLRKTELACRLHYHQLSHGTNRRKRAASFSSVSSRHSPASPKHRLSPDEVSTAPTTPEQNLDRPPSVNPWKARSDRPEPASAASPIMHKSILPKLVHSRPYSPAKASSGLRLNCDIFATNLSPVIDRHRLRDVYETHRVSFWKMIAADYGDGVDPNQLEATWRRGSVPGPPTPDEIPESSRFRSLTEGRLVLPALQPTPFERSFSHFRSRISVSAAPSPVVRSASKLAIPSTASTESLPSPILIPSTAIAALLNGSAES